MSARYTYLFPYEKVSQNSRIIIYGSGDVGQEYLQQMKLTGYCEVVALVDRAYDKYPPMIVPVYPVEKIRELEFDYVVLAFKMGAHVRAVTKALLSLGVLKEKIIYIEPRREVPVLISSEKYGAGQEFDFAYLHGGISIALKYGPGLGDAIVKKKFFTELVAMAPECCIDIYSPGAGMIISSIYSDQANLNLVIDDGGALYASQKIKYDVAFTVAFMLDMDELKFDRLNDVAPLFAQKMKKLQDSVKAYNLPAMGVTSRYVHFNRMKFLGLNYYNYLNHTGVFAIKDHKVDIPIDSSFEAAYEKLALSSRYITVNYGGGVDASGRNNGIAKDWPLPHMERFVRLFKDTYPDIKVVQVGSAGTAEISGVDEYFLGESLELVKYILRGSLLHVDKEGGLVHLATQLGTKCVVCFGPTQVKYFGYDENINILVGDCHGCHCLYDGFDVCAKGMNQPECMWGITAEKVLSRGGGGMKSIICGYPYKLLFELYRQHVLKKIGNDKNNDYYKIKNVIDETFRESWKKLCGYDNYKNKFIDSGINIDEITDVINCSINSEYEICEHAVKYIEKMCDIKKDADEETKLRIVSDIIYHMPDNPLFCSNVVVSYADKRNFFWGLTMQAEKWIQLNFGKENGDYLQARIIFTDDFDNVRNDIAVSNKKGDSNKTNGEYISYKDTKDEVCTIIINIPVALRHGGYDICKINDELCKCWIVSIIVHEMTHFYDVETVYNKIKEINQNEVNVYNFRNYSEGRAKYYQELYYIKHAKRNLVNYVNNCMKMTSVDSLYNNAVELGRLKCWIKNYEYLGLSKEMRKKLKLEAKKLLNRMEDKRFYFAIDKNVGSCTWNGHLLLLKRVERILGKF